MMGLDLEILFMSFVIDVNFRVKYSNLDFLKMEVVGLKQDLW